MFTKLIANKLLIKLLIIGLLFVVGGLFLPKGDNVQAQRYITVCTEGTCDFDNIQEAVDIASNGSEIRVAKGIYQIPEISTEEIDMVVGILDKTITLRGGYIHDDFQTLPDPENNITKIDGETIACGVVLINNSSTIEGFHITQSRPTEDFPMCGGIFVQYGSPTIKTNKIYENNNYPVYGDGGGLTVYYGQDVQIIGNSFINNNAGGGGGGISLTGSSAILINNIIAANTIANSTSYSGSGLSIQDSSSITLIHNTFSDNTGGTGNGISVFYNSNVNMVNTIVSNHDIGIYVDNGNTATIDTILWYGNGSNSFGGGTINITNEIIGNPDFVDPTNEDYHIGLNSSAIDQGINAGVTIDIDGDVRPIGNGYDIGADEQCNCFSEPSVNGWRIGDNQHYGHTHTPRLDASANQFCQEKGFNSFTSYTGSILPSGGVHTYWENYRWVVTGNSSVAYMDEVICKP